MTACRDRAFSTNQGGSPVLQFIVVGLVFGSIYALAASGLVITYVSTGVLNFAFGAFAFFIARFYYFLDVEKEWGILLSAAVSLLVLAPFMGIFFYMSIFRFLRLSSQLIKVVVTIGLSVVIPVLGHATWHLYRKVIAVDPNARPIPPRPPRVRKPAADFPANLFPWRRRDDA